MSKFPVRLVHTLKTHHGPVNAVTFSSDPGTYLLTGSSDRSVHLTRARPASSAASGDSETTSPIQRYDAHGYSVLDVAVASDNARFASVGGDRLVFLWDVERGDTIRRFSGHNARIEAVQFAGEGDAVLVSGSADTTVNLWDTRSNTPKPIQTLAEARDTVSSLHVHGATYSIASGSYDGRARVYDVRMGRTTVDVLAHPVTSVQCSRDGNALLASTPADGHIRMLDRRDGKLLKAFAYGDGRTAHSGHHATAAAAAAPRKSELRIRSVFASADAVVLGGSDADLVLPTAPGVGPGLRPGQPEVSVFAWDVLTGNVIARIPAGQGVKAVSCVAWNERGKCWAGGCSNGSVKVYA